MSFKSENSEIKQFTPWYISTGIGFVIGSTEAFVNHPLWSIKTRIQAKLPTTLNPVILYKGLGPHVVSSIPLDMFQVTCSRIAFERLFSDQLSYNSKRLTAGYIGGMCSALVSCPSEMVMTWQQKNMTFSQALRSIYRTSGKMALYRGMIPTTIREGIFCAGFFGGTHIMHNNLHKYGEAFAAFSSGVVTGTAVAVLSQPFDTLKTTMQISSSTMTIREAARRMTVHRKILPFFDGLSLRITRVVSAVFVLGTLNNKLEELFLEEKP